VQHRHVSESVGLADVFLLSALQVSELAAITHGPSPMRSLSKILSRPSNERPCFVVPVGCPHHDGVVPDIA